MRRQTRVVRRQEQAALVEYVAPAGPVRTVVPLSALDADDRVEDWQLEAGVPHGVPWARLIRLSATPEQLQAALRNAGIWTREDLVKRSREVPGILQSVYGVDLATLMAIARSNEEVDQ